MEGKGRGSGRSPMYLSLPFASILETRGGNFARERLMKRATATGCSLPPLTHRVLLLELWLRGGKRSESILTFCGRGRNNCPSNWTLPPSAFLTRAPRDVCPLVLQSRRSSSAFALGTFRTILKTRRRRRRRRRRPLSILQLARCLAGILNFHSAVIQP